MVSARTIRQGGHRLNRPETSEEPMMGLAKKLMNSGVEVNLGELEEVKQIIMDFHRRPKAQTT
jgi:hypothetical protein